MNQITADVRTRMEGGVEHLEAIVFGLDRVEKALEANEPLTKALEAMRQLEANAGDSAQRATRFAELKSLLATLAQTRARLDQRLVSLFRELRLEPPATFEQRLAAAESHLPILYRGALEGSGLAWAGGVIAAATAALIASSHVPWVAVLPISAGIGGLLWDRSRARMIIVSQLQLVVGFRSAPLTAVREIVVPPGVGAYLCRLEVAGGSDIQMPAITALLDALRGRGVEVRFE